jgi:hypothetical protein
MSKIQDNLIFCDAKLALLNLTDQKNWSPPNPFYGNDSVVAECPFHVEATITFKF